VTVSRHRRRVTTTWAFVAAVVGVVAAVALGAAGYVAIANTTDGEVVGGGVREVTFPATPTASLAVLDNAGHLASLAVLVARPDDGDEPGRGGTVVPIPISADASGGFGDERLPLGETVALFGPESLTDEVPNLLGVGVDGLVVVDEQELAQLLAPLGPIAVDLPTAVRDSSGRQLAAAGPQTLDPDEVAAVLSATDPTISGAQRYPIDVVVWRALADAVGDGVGTPAPGDVFGRVTAGPVAVQPLRSSPIVSLDRNPRGVDAAALDRAEVLVMFGHIAPGKVAAPNPGYNFRLVSRFGDDQLPGDVTRLDVAYTATEALLDAGANVISVDTSERAAEPKTVIEVSDENLVPAARTLEDVFGPVEVRVADTQIAGIDVVAELGTDYLATLDASPATATTGPATTAPATTGSTG
jgi:CBS domain-containing protein